MKYFTFSLLFVVATGLISQACAPATEPDCSGPADCVTANEPMSPACPPSYAQLCLNGVCAPSSEDSMAVRADVALHFSLTGQVASVTYAFVDPRSASSQATLTCQDLGSALQDPAASINVVAAGFVNFQATSGTAMFPDANFGQVPLNADLLLVRGFSQSRGEGNFVAAACLEQVLIEGTDPLKLTVSLRPVD